MSSKADPSLSFDQIVDRAKAGGQPELWDLHVQLTPENFTNDVVEIVLSQLDLDRVPNIITGEYLRPPHVDYAKAAVPCLSMLPVIARACDYQPLLKPSIVRRVGQATDGICAWINFALHFGLSSNDPTPPSGGDFQHNYITYARTLFEFTQLDVRFPEALFTSPTYLKLLIRLWMTRGPNKGHFFFSRETDEACPILNLMLFTSRHAVGSQLITDQIFCRSPHFPVAFAKAITTRGLQILAYAFPPSKASVYLDALLRIAENLIVVDEGFRQPFRKAEFLLTMGRILNRISVEASETCQPTKYMKQVTDSVIRLAIVFVMKEESRAVHNWRDFVDAEFYALLVRSLAHVEPQDRQTAETLRGFLNIFVVYTMYPAVLEKLKTARIGEMAMNTVVVNSYTPIFFLILSRYHVCAPII